jgi:hypothetical protein
MLEVASVNEDYSNRLDQIQITKIIQLIKEQFKVYDLGNIKQDLLIRWLIDDLYRERYHKTDVKILIKTISSEYSEYIEMIYAESKRIEIDLLDIFDKTTDYMDFNQKLNSIYHSDNSEEIIQGHGKKEYLQLNKPLTSLLTDIFETLMPGNGELATIIWSSAIATAKGRPNMVILTGDPGEGKSVLMDYILQFIPEEYIIRINDATESSLFDPTQPMDYLDNKIVYLGDLGDKNGFEDSQSLRTILRILLSDGYYSRNIKEKQKDEDGVQNWVTVHQELIGNPSTWYTSVRNDNDAQDQDRSIIATVNLSKEREIKRIIQHKNKNSKTGRRIRKVIDEYTPILHSIFEYLVSIDKECICPWDLTKLENLHYGFRNYNRLLTLTEMLAFINMDYKEQFNGFILADKEDLKTIAKFMFKGTGKYSDLFIKRLDTIFNEYGAYKKEYDGDQVMLAYEPFTRSDVVALFPDTYSNLQSGTSTVYRDILKPAIENKWINEDKTTRPYTYSFDREPDFNGVDNPIIREIESLEIDWEMLNDEYGSDD